MTTDNNKEKIRNLRRSLHREPELSGQETLTAARIKDFIVEHHPAEVKNHIGGNGLAAVFKYAEEGPVVMIRCELDALPIEESNSFEHRSFNPGVSHKCGHDGHMAIVAGLIFWFFEQNFHRRKIILLL